MINHQVLQIHHLRDDLGGPLAWDLGFLAFGAAGLALRRWDRVRARATGFGRGRAGAG